MMPHRRLCLLKEQLGERRQSGVETPDRTRTTMGPRLDPMPPGGTVAEVDAMNRTQAIAQPRQPHLSQLPGDGGKRLIPTVLSHWLETVCLRLLGHVVKTVRALFNSWKFSVTA